MKSTSFHSTDQETHAEYTVRTTSKGAYYTAVIVGFQGKDKMGGTVWYDIQVWGAHTLAAIIVTASFVFPHPHREHNVV